MKVYLGLCALKRPFDDQRQARIALETAAVLAIVEAIDDGRITTVRSIAHDIENGRNPKPERAGVVRSWLERLGESLPSNEGVAGTAKRLCAEGLAPMDALHLAWAQHLEADVFITTDRRLLKLASRTAQHLNVTVSDPVSFVEGNLS